MDLDSLCRYMPTNLTVALNTKKFNKRWLGEALFCKGSMRSLETREPPPSKLSGDKTDIMHNCRHVYKDNARRSLGQSGALPAK